MTTDDKAIEQQLRILGYSRGTVEWDGALAAARAHARTLSKPMAVEVTMPKAARAKLVEFFRTKRARWGITWPEAIHHATAMARRTGIRQRVYTARIVDGRRWYRWHNASDPIRQPVCEATEMGPS